MYHDTPFDFARKMAEIVTQRSERMGFKLPAVMPTETERFKAAEPRFDTFRAGWEGDDKPHLVAEPGEDGLWHGHHDLHAEPSQELELSGSDVDEDEEDDGD